MYRSAFLRCSLLLTLAALGSVSAFPDSFAVTYLDPGVQTPTGITTHFEGFNTQSAGTALNSPLVTDFGGSGFTGAYSGDLLWYGANTYGGAGGTGVYAEVVNGFSYTLSLSSPVNYFGLWFSALDPGNLLQFYNGGALLFSFTPADYTALAGACPGSPFCGNPNAAFAGQDPKELFAYLNFYDSNGTFDKVVFSESGNAGGGFESDNQTVGMLSSAPGGTGLTPVPEPSLLMAAGVMCAVVLMRKVSQSKKLSES